MTWKREMACFLYYDGKTEKQNRFIYSFDLYFPYVCRLMEVFAKNVQNQMYIFYVFMLKLYGNYELIVL